MKTYYAESTGQSVVEDIYEGGFLRHAKNSEPYCDLRRFNSKKERDDFVDELDSHYSILARDAKRSHPEQFQFWSKNEL